MEGFFGFQPVSEKGWFRPLPLVEDFLSVPHPGGQTVGFFPPKQRLVIEPEIHTAVDNFYDTIAFPHLPWRAYNIITSVADFTVQQNIAVTVCISIMHAYQWGSPKEDCTLLFDNNTFICHGWDISTSRCTESKDNCYLKVTTIQTDGSKAIKNKFDRCTETKDLEIKTIWPDRAVFNWVSKVISHLLWFCITTLCNWLTKLAPLSQPMGIQTKTNRVFAARVFPRLAPVTCICFKYVRVVRLQTLNFTDSDYV